MTSGWQKTTKNKTGFTVNQTVEKVMNNSKITRRQHIELTNAILSENKISEEERRQINRILDYIQIGKIKIVDFDYTPKSK